MEQVIPVAAPEAPWTERRPVVAQAIFVFLLLLSGFCGISYEVLYARVLSNFIGDQFAITASILLTFMAGIGAGTLWAHRLWRRLWLIEGTIGLFGLWFALGAGQIESWYYSTLSLSQRGLGGAMLVCFALLCVPAFLIGCSLPLFAGYLGRLSTKRVFARAYMVYNFGAALTVLVIEFWLLRRFGLRHTILCMAGLNGLVCLALFFGFSGLRAKPEEARERWEFPTRRCLALAVASVASAIFQLLMVKIAECLLGPFRETFALVLAVVLFGIAAGSAIARRWRLDFGWVLVAGLAGLVWLLGGYEWLARAYAHFYPAAAQGSFTLLLFKALALFALMGAPAIAFGATIPALLGEMGQVARNSGRLLCISSLANALGFLLMSLVLHRWLDYGVLALVVAGLVVFSVVAHGGLRLRPAGAALGLGALAVVLHQARWNESLLYLSYDYFSSTQELNWARKMFKFPEKFKGAQDVFSLNHFGDNIHFFINGYVSIGLNSTAEKIVGAFPALFAPETDRALVLGTGSGATAGTVASLFERVDTVEINPVVLKNLWRMAPYNFNILSRPGVNFITDDAIHFTKVCRQRYPLIINTVTSPRYFSSSKLYTAGFLEAVRNCLTEEGVYVTWVDGRIGRRGLDIILKTLQGSFPECSLGGVRSGYFLLLCSKAPLKLRQPGLITGNPLLAEYFQTNGLRADWLPYGLLAPRAYDLISDAGVPLNTMDYPALEFEMARRLEEDPDLFSATLCEKLDAAELARALGPGFKFNPVHFALYGQLLFRDSALLERIIKVAAKESEDFVPDFRAAKLEHFSAWAALANTSKAHHYYGEELIAQRRWQEAIAAEKKALAINPETDDAYYNIALAQEKLGEFQAALANYLNEWKVDPEDREVLVGLARAHFKLKEYTKALECLQRALNEEDRAEIHLLLSRVLPELGREAEGEAEYQKFLRFGARPPARKPAND